MIRLAAVGDVHCGTETREEVRSQFASVRDHADALLLAGDLTRLGTPEEAEALADALSALRGMPIAAVLGNHDYHSDRQDEVRRIVQTAGVEVLEGRSVVWDVNGVRVGVAGIKGFAGGFEGAHATGFGEQEMKAFVGHAQALATQLDECLQRLDADLRILLLHYAPVRDTLSGEPREIFPFLGNYLFGELADAHGVDLVLHGHAHRGVERGRTPGGIPVRNVAQAVIQQGYAVYTLDPMKRPLATSGGRPTTERRFE